MYFIELPHLSTLSKNQLVSLLALLFWFSTNYFCFSLQYWGSILFAFIFTNSFIVLTSAFKTTDTILDTIIALITAFCFEALDFYLSCSHVSLVFSLSVGYGSTHFPISYTNFEWQLAAILFSFFKSEFSCAFGKKGYSRLTFSASQTQSSFPSCTPQWFKWLCLCFYIFLSTGLLSNIHLDHLFLLSYCTCPVYPGF